MPAYVLGMIEIWHPEDYLFSSDEHEEARQRGYGEPVRSKTEILQQIPHRCQLRHPCPNSMPSPTPSHTASGREIRFPECFVSGPRLAQVIQTGDPRLLHLARKKKPHWKLSSRGSAWYDESGNLETVSRLTPDRHGRLISNLLQHGRLLLKGLYVNPSVSSDYPETEWVLMALGPCPSTVNTEGPFDFEMAQRTFSNPQCWIMWE